MSPPFDCFIQLPIYDDTLCCKSLTVKVQMYRANYILVIIMLVIAVICLAAVAFGAQDFSCNFDNGNCGFVQRTDDHFDWTRQYGDTPSWNTGPYTDASGYGHYMYTEASYPRKRGDKAKMETAQAYSFDGGNKCLRFYYYMYGADMGTLKVYVGSTMVYEDYGDLGEYWYTANFQVPVSQGSHKIMFEGIIGSGYRSDIAIDEIVLEDCTGGSNTPPPPTQAPTPPPPATDAPASPPPPPATDAPASPPPPSGSCGIRPTTRIVGGAAATHGDWPWQAMLRDADYDNQFCGGALVAPQWVVSASHCVSGKTPSKVLIRMGAHKRMSTVGTEQDFKVTRIIMHESYQNPKTYSHDIALLKLDKPALLNQYTNLVCLPESIADVAPGANCWITGWGTLSSGGVQPDTLQQASVPIVDQTTCKNSYPDEIDNSMICAGLKQGGIDACQGDSGGPMVCENGGKFYLHGATSWGYGCAAPDKYGVYARVKYLHSWIKTKMANN